MSRGDAEFQEFIRTSERRLVSYLHYATGGRDDIEDVFQDACIAAYRNWSKVRDLERPGAWLIRVARNLLVNRAKRRAVERRSVDWRSEAAAPGADEGAQARETRAAVAAAVAQLPEPQREAVSLKIWGELTWVEIGLALGVSDDTAARHFSRGLKALAPKLKGYSI